jgi:hypothetical protein
MTAISCFHGTRSKKPFLKSFQQGKNDFYPVIIRSVNSFLPSNLDAFAMRTMNYLLSSIRFFVSLPSRNRFI